MILKTAKFLLQLFQHQLIQKKPDFSALLNVCRIIGPLLKKDIVVFESTVFPGATEEICGPELESILKN